MSAPNVRRLGNSVVGSLMPKEHTCFRTMQTRVFDRYLNTIWAIASSRYVTGFVVGYTCMAAKERFAAYKTNGYDYLVILADRLTLSEALALEQRLQEACKVGKARGAPYKRKYDLLHRALPYYRSVGQGSRDPEGRTHSVYMAWYE